jgi:hypothetical protein
MSEENKGDAPTPRSNGYSPLEIDNQRYRKRNSILKAKVAELEAKVPKADAVIIAPADAAELAEYRKLSLKPADITAKLAASTALEAQLAETKAKDLVRDVATAAGYDTDVLADVTQLKGLKHEIREEMVDGKKVKVPYVVTGEGAAATATKLTEYAEANLTVHLPSLRQTTTERKSGIVYPKQPSSGSAADTTNTKAIIARVTGGVLPSERNQPAKTTT